MHDYEDKDEWYNALVMIAERHDNKRAVRDREGWTFNWRHEAPEKAYYEEFPEHKPDSVPAHGCGHMQGRGVLSDAEAIIAKQSAALKLASAALGEVQDLIGESHGVYGLHLNGDESPWGELEQGGRFERLTLLNEALAAIDALEGE